MRKLDLYCDGSAWYAHYSVFDTQPEQQSYFFNEFTANADEAGEVGGSGWTFTENGTGTVLQIDAEANHPGIIRLTTGTTSGNDETIHSGGSSTLNSLMMNQDKFSVTWLIRIPTITTATARIGYGLTSTLDGMTGASHYAAFEYIAGTSANWRCITGDGTTQQTTTTGTAVGTNTWTKLKIVRDGGTVRFYLDNVNVANHSTNVAGAQAGNLAAGVQTDTAAARTMDIDYCKLILGAIAR
jgi:hypothetical protein